MVKKKDYQDILDCIKSDQVSAPEIAKYFKDKGFYKFYKDNQKPTKKDTNEWIKDYFDDEFTFKQDRLFKNKSWIKSSWEFALKGFTGDFIEKTLRNWQIKRSKKKL